MTSSSISSSTSSSSSTSCSRKRHDKRKISRLERHRRAKRSRSSSSSDSDRRRNFHLKRKKYASDKSGSDVQINKSKKHYREEYSLLKSQKKKSKEVKRKRKALVERERVNNSCKEDEMEKSKCCVEEWQRPNNALQVMMDAQEQQKALIRHNAEIAKARLASGELQRAKEEQAEFQRLYGTVDWRAKKKLRKEKKVLERTIAAGKKLASLEEREHARMDAFRVALGLPTAEAQRQAEWRVEATKALIRMEACSKDVTPSKNSRNGIIGPSLPP